MRLAFCGAGGTGKGTLCEALKVSLTEVLGRDFKVLHSPNKPLGQEFFKATDSYKDISLDQVRDFQYAIIGAVVWEEFQAIQAKADIISERSIYDYIPFMPDIYDGYITQVYKELIIDFGNKYPYDALFYIPATDFMPEAEPWKERAQEDRLSTDEQLQNLLFRTNLIGCKKFSIYGSVPERVETILNILQTFKSVANFKS